MGKKVKTHYMIVLDQSGSMETIKETVISLFNEQLMSLKKESADMGLEVTLSVFNTKVQVIYLNEKIEKVKALTNQNYNPNWGTALYDGIMMTYNQMKPKVKKGDRFVALILTDGMENSSSEYGNEDVQKLIKKIEKRGGSFNFLCSDIDAGNYSDSLDFEVDGDLSFDSSYFDIDLSSKLNEVKESVLNINDDKNV